MWNLLAHLEKQPQKDTATNNHFRIPVKCCFLGQTQSGEGIFVEWLNKHWFAGISIFPSSWEGGGKAGRWCAGWHPASLQSTSGNNTLCPPGSSYDPACRSASQLTICRLRPPSFLCHESHRLPTVRWDYRVPFHIVYSIAGPNIDVFVLFYSRLLFW